MAIKHVVYKKNRTHISGNWGKLQCSPIGPLLQMLGLAPGNASDTSNKCKSSGFSSQFNSGMTGHINKSDKMSANMSIQDKILNKIRGVITRIEQAAFKELSKVATIIFKLYTKIGNIFFIMIKHIINITKIFKAVVHYAGAIAKLLFEYINIFVDIINFFSP